MKLNELKSNDGATKARKRVGRGIASGTGKTCGVGQKGQKSRSGVAIKGFEGGQMPIYRRLPKMGFSNDAFAQKLAEINVGKLQEAVDSKKLDAKKDITEDMLVETGVISRKKDGVKILGNGEIKAKLNITVTKASESATKAIEKAGGKVTLIAPKEQPEGKLQAKGKQKTETRAAKKASAKKAAKK